MHDMTLGQKQELFSECIAQLITEMYRRGYKVRCGDFWAKPRMPLEHKIYSQHYKKLAADLNLFWQGVYCKDETHHKQFAVFWESLHPLCRSGIAFQDSNHYELVG